VRVDKLGSTSVIEIEQSLTVTRKAIPSLRANFAWTLAGNVLYGACQWGMLSVLAKLGNAAIVGQFTFGLAVSAPVFLFTGLQLRSVQATDVRSECDFANCFTLRLLATVLGLCVIVAVLPFATDSTAVRIIVLLISASKGIDCMSDVIAGLLQREERLDRVAISLTLRGAGSVLVFSFTFAYFHSLTLSVIGMSGVWLAVLLLYDVPNSRAFLKANDGFFHFDRKELRRLIMLSLPLGWVATFGSLTVNIPRYILQRDLGLAEQGIFASLAYLIVAINLTVLALAQSATTRLSVLYAEGHIKQFRRLLTKLSMLGVLVAVAGVPMALLVGRPLLTMIYRPEYGEHAGLLALFVGTAGVGMVGSFLFCGASAARAFRNQVPMYFLAMLVAALGSAALVPRYGMIGAGISLLFSAATTVFGGLLVLRRILNAQPEGLRA
jgi:O-antigen/teichoic acid export membrane protein